MKILLPVFLFILIPSFAIAENADSLWMATNYTKKEVYITMRDGAKLFTAIYKPKKNSKEKHPILLNRTPYSVAPYGENNYKPFWSTPYMAYFKKNYIVVLQDV